MESSSTSLAQLYARSGSRVNASQAGQATMRRPPVTELRQDRDNNSAAQESSSAKQQIGLLQEQLAMAVETLQVAVKVNTDLQRQMQDVLLAKSALASGAQPHADGDYMYTRQLLGRAQAPVQLAGHALPGSQQSALDVRLSQAFTQLASQQQQGNYVSVAESHVSVPMRMPAGAAASPAGRLTTQGAGRESQASTTAASPPASRTSTSRGRSTARSSGNENGSGSNGGGRAAFGSSSPTGRQGQQQKGKGRPQLPSKDEDGYTAGGRTSSGGRNGITARQDNQQQQAVKKISAVTAARLAARREQEQREQHMQLQQSDGGGADGAQLPHAGMPGVDGGDADGMLRHQAFTQLQRQQPYHQHQMQSYTHDGYHDSYYHDGGGGAVPSSSTHDGYHDSYYHDGGGGAVPSSSTLGSWGTSVTQTRQSSAAGDVPGARMTMAAPPPLPLPALPSLQQQQSLFVGSAFNSSSDVSRGQQHHHQQLPVSKSSLLLQHAAAAAASVSAFAQSVDQHEASVGLQHYGIPTSPQVASIPSHWLADRQRALAAAPAASFASIAAAPAPHVQQQPQLNHLRDSYGAAASIISPSYHTRADAYRSLDNDAGHHRFYADSTLRGRSASDAASFLGSVVGSSSTTGHQPLSSSLSALPHQQPLMSKLAVDMVAASVRADIDQRFGLDFGIDQDGSWPGVAYEHQNPAPMQSHSQHAVYQYSGAGDAYGQGHLLHATDARSPPQAPPVAPLDSSSRVHHQQGHSHASSSSSATSTAHGTGWSSTADSFLRRAGHIRDAILKATSPKQPQSSQAQAQASGYEPQPPHRHQLQHDTSGGSGTHVVHNFAGIDEDLGKQSHAVAEASTQHQRHHRQPSEARSEASARDFDAWPSTSVFDQLRIDFLRPNEDLKQSGNGSSDERRAGSARRGDARSSGRSINAGIIDVDIQSRLIPRQRQHREQHQQRGSSSGRAHAMREAEVDIDGDADLDHYDGATDVSGSGHYNHRHHQLINHKQFGGDVDHEQYEEGDEEEGDDNLTQSARTTADVTRGLDFRQASRSKSVTRDFVHLQQHVAAAARTRSPPRPVAGATSGIVGRMTDLELKTAREQRAAEREARGFAALAAMAERTMAQEAKPQQQQRAQQKGQTKAWDSSGSRSRSRSNANNASIVAEELKKHKQQARQKQSRQQSQQQHKQQHVELQDNNTRSNSRFDLTAVAAALAAMDDPHSPLGKAMASQSQSQRPGSSRADAASHSAGERRATGEIHGGSGSAYSSPGQHEVDDEIVAEQSQHHDVHQRHHQQQQQQRLRHDPRHRHMSVDGQSIDSMQLMDKIDGALARFDSESVDESHEHDERNGGGRAQASHAAALWPHEQHEHGIGMMASGGLHVIHDRRGNGADQAQLRHVHW